MICPEPITQSDHKTADEPRSGDAVRSAGAALLATARARNAGHVGGTVTARRGTETRRPKSQAPGRGRAGRAGGVRMGCGLQLATRVDVQRHASAGRPWGAGVCEAWAPLVTPL